MTKEQNLKRWLVMGCIIIVIIAIAVISVICILRNNDETTNKAKGIDKETQSKIDQTLEDDLSVAIGQFQVTQENNTTVTKLPIKIKNKKDTVQSYSIKIEAVDKDGNVIAEEFAVANNLSAGERKEITIFEDITRDKIEKLKEATFRIAKISLY